MGHASYINHLYHPQRLRYVDTSPRNSHQFSSLLIPFHSSTMLSDQDLRLVRSFEEGQVTSSPFPTVTAAFLHYAASYPNAVAARDMSSSPLRELTYAELAYQSQILALKLRSLGVGHGQRIPLLVKRGLEMIIGIWAVLSCGAQYVPLDGGVVPESTIRTVTEQSGSDVVLCISSTEHRLKDLRQTGSLVPVLIEEHCQNNCSKPTTYLDLATPESGCYVIYTSGTVTLSFHFPSVLLTTNQERLASPKG